MSFSSKDLIMSRGDEQKMANRLYNVLSKWAKNEGLSVEKNKKVMGDFTVIKIGDTFRPVIGYTDVDLGIFYYEKDFPKESNKSFKCFQD
jgi:hypothetical protein